ncbi:MAG TPA: TonB family protein [Brevundimonas sp.]|uniref:TonB family protein n=1 Tax=Brevundimonas sp. TaxID=1871086 RepID=UPI002ED8858F
MAASPLLAQQALDDWDLTVDAARRVTLASSAFSSGQTIAVRCSAGTLDVMIAGLPAREGVSRYLELGRGDAKAEPAHWLNNGGTIFSTTPARTARELRRQGRLEVAVAVEPGDDSALRRYQFELPSGSAAVEQVLNACDTPVDEARDSLPRWVQPRTYPPSLWRSLLRPEFPQAAASAGIESGFVVLGCVVAPQGRLADCTIEHESDRRAGFGRAALRSSASARLSEPTEGGPAPGEVIIFTVRFRVS